MNYIEYRKEVFAYTQKAFRTGLIRISSGNISMRTEDDNVAITPSSIPYDEMDESQIVILDMDGKTVDGNLKPSVEKMLHINTIKARDDVQAVVHTHSVCGITLSLIGVEIPPLSVEMAFLGAPIQTLPYRLPGSIDFANTVAEYFGNNPERKAALIQNHGTVAVGSSLKEAFQNAYNLETGSSIFYKTLLLGREIRLLSETDLEELQQVY